LAPVFPFSAIFALQNNNSRNSKPWAGYATFAARGAAPWRVQCRALEDEVTGLASRGCHDQPLPAAANAALDVTEILLEDLDRQTERMPEIVELPLISPQPFDDFLPASSHEIPGQRFSAFLASHSWIGLSSMYSSSTTPTPLRIRTLTEASRRPRGPLQTARSASGARFSSM